MGSIKKCIVTGKCFKVSNFIYELFNVCSYLFQSCFGSVFWSIIMALGAGGIPSCPTETWLGFENLGCLLSVA